MTYTRIQCEIAAKIQRTICRSSACLRPDHSSPSTSTKRRSSCCVQSTQRDITVFRMLRLRSRSSHLFDRTAAFLPFALLGQLQSRDSDRDASASEGGDRAGSTPPVGRLRLKRAALNPSAPALIIEIMWLLSSVTAPPLSEKCTHFSDCALCKLSIARVNSHSRRIDGCR